MLSVSDSWTHSWQERNNIFGNMYFINIFLICCGCGLPYLIRGGFDSFVRYRYHWNSNVFLFFGCSGMIMGIVGLSIGDGGGNNLVETLNYHSAFVPIYSLIEIAIGVVVHYFIVIFEESSWKHHINSIPDPASCTSEANYNTAQANFISNQESCDVDRSSSKFFPLKSIPDKTIEEGLREDIIEDGIDGIKLPNEGERPNGLTIRLPHL